MAAARPSQSAPGMLFGAAKTRLTVDRRSPTAAFAVILDHPVGANTATAGQNHNARMVPATTATAHNVRLSTRARPDSILRSRSLERSLTRKLPMQNFNRKKDDSISRAGE